MKEIKAVKKWRIVQRVNDKCMFERIMNSGEVLNVIFDAKGGDKGSMLLDVLCRKCFEVKHDENTTIHFCCCRQHARKGVKHENEIN